MVEVTTDEQVSNLTISCGDELVIRNGATLTVDEPMEVKTIQIGDNSEEETGHLILDEVSGISYDNPLIRFCGSGDLGFILHGGSFGLEDLVNSIQNDSRYVIKGDRKYTFKTDEDFDINDWQFKNISEIEFFDILPVLTFRTRDDKSIDLTFNRDIRDLDRNPSYSIHTNKIDGGRGVWSRFDHSEGMGFSITGQVNRLHGGKLFLKRLELVGEDFQRNAALLFSCEEFLGTCYMTSAPNTAEYASIGEYSIDFIEVKQNYEGH